MQGCPYWPPTCPQRGDLAPAAALVPTRLVRLPCRRREAAVPTLKAGLSVAACAKIARHHSVPSTDSQGPKDRLLPRGAGAKALIPELAPHDRSPDCPCSCQRIGEKKSADCGRFPSGSVPQAFQPERTRNASGRRRSEARNEARSALMAKPVAKLVAKPLRTGPAARIWPLRHQFRPFLNS